MIKRWLKLLSMQFFYFFYLFVKLTKRNKNIARQKILVLYLSGFGDILCLTEFCKKLREKFPRAQLTACFFANQIEVQQHFFAFDAYIRHQNYRDTLSRIRHEHFDLIIVPGWALKNSLLAFFSGAKAVLGYLNNRTGSYQGIGYLEGWGLKIKKAKQDQALQHISERANLILEYFGIVPVNASQIVTEIQTVKENYAVIHAGARFIGRRWQTENYAEIVDFLLNEKKIEHVFLIGGREDRVLNKQIMEKTVSRKITDLAGKNSFYENLRLIRKATLFIGNDSGPMHMAALAGVPTIGLFGPNFPRISGPLGKNAASIFHELPCSGCNQRGCRINYKCIKLILSEEVKSSVSQLI